MLNDIIYITGQVLGIVAVILGFVSFQMKTARGILLFQTITAAVFSAHYLMIGAWTAVALNSLAAVQNIVYYFRDKRGSKSVVPPIIFCVLLIASTILTWEGWHSALIMAGLVVLSLSLALFDAQKIRFSMFIKSPLCLVYNIIAKSGGGIIYECTVLVSSAIGIIKESISKRKE